VLAAALSAVAFASPPPVAAQSPNPAQRPTLTRAGCNIAADVALTARALAAEKIDRATGGRVMALAFEAFKDPENGGVPDGLREELTDFAYKRAESPTDIALVVLQICVAGRGDLGPILGTQLRWRPSRLRGLRV
jgi:hypothetical protein